MHTSPYPQVCGALTHAGRGGLPAASSPSAAASSQISGRVMSSALAAARPPGSLSVGAGRGVRPALPAARPPPDGGRGLGAGRARPSLDSGALAPGTAAFMAGRDGRAPARRLKPYRGAGGLRWELPAARRALLSETNPAGHAPPWAGSTAPAAGPRTGPRAAPGQSAHPAAAGEPGQQGFPI